MNEKNQKGVKKMERNQNHLDEFTELLELQHDCQICGGPGQYLGTLGRRIHFRCQDCGMDFSWIQGTNLHKIESVNR